MSVRPSVRLTGVIFIFCQNDGNYEHEIFIRKSTINGSPAWSELVEWEEIDQTELLFRQFRRHIWQKARMLADMFSVDAELLLVSGANVYEIRTPRRGHTE